MDVSAANYVRAVLELYLALPETPVRPSRADRLTAAELYRRGVPLFNVEAALALACARRAGRDQSAPPLNPIRSLRYFLPVIEEIAAWPSLPLAYLQYCRSKFIGKPKQPLPRAGS
jgi:hypothetical protein